MPLRSNLSSHQRIKYNIRKKVVGTATRPRFTVFRSLNNIYAQLVDDINGKTLFTVSTISKDVKDSLKEKASKTEKSKIIGKKLAEKALENNIKKVVFDRNGYLYHGRVKAIADAAREAGLEF
ncbi:MAG TPA: 50S ribosomal protein L18 [Ignavibacteria bacterium]